MPQCELAEDGLLLRDQRIDARAGQGDHLADGRPRPLDPVEHERPDRIAVRVISNDEIDRSGLHRCNLGGLRSVLHALTPPAEACLVDGFKLGRAAPEHVAVVDGDEKSAAIAAASIVAKVTRDRLMRRVDALYPHYGFASHVGYITPAHSAVVRARGPSAVHRRSFQARCYAADPAPAA